MMKRFLATMLAAIFLTGCSAGPDAKTLANKVAEAVGRWTDTIEIIEATPTNEINMLLHGNTVAAWRIKVTGKGCREAACYILIQQDRRSASDVREAMEMLEALDLDGDRLWMRGHFVNQSVTMVVSTAFEPELKGAAQGAFGGERP